MAKVFSSKQSLPNGEEKTRWHLLDGELQLIKPVERFLRFRQAGGVAIGTLKTYAEKLKFFWEYLSLKELDWQDFTNEHLAEFGYWYLTGGLLLNDQIASIAPENVTAFRSEHTVNLAITAVVQFYEFHANTGSVDDKNLRHYKALYGQQRSWLLAGYVKQSPVGVKRVHYKAKQKFPGCLTADQVRTLVNACNTSRDKLILWLLIDLGLRKGELLGLHNCDIDWKAKTLKIVRRDNNPNHAYAKGQERELSIAGLISDTEFCGILTQYLDEEYPHDEVQSNGHDMFFVVLHPGSPSYGQPLDPQNLNKLLKRLHKKTGIDIERLYPHLFRHSFATHNIREGRKKGKGKDEVAKAVQRQLGHRSISTTLEIYDHSFGEAEMVQEMERILKSDGTTTSEN